MKLHVHLGNVSLGSFCAMGNLTADSATIPTSSNALQGRGLKINLECFLYFFYYIDSSFYIKMYKLERIELFSSNFCKIQL